MGSSRMRWAMIRRMQKKDTGKVADIWLCTNLEAHGFIPAKYWKDNFETVKEMLGQAEVYVCGEEKEIQDAFRRHRKKAFGLRERYKTAAFLKRVSEE